MYLNLFSKNIKYNLSGIIFFAFLLGIYQGYIAFKGP